MQFNADCSQDGTFAIVAATFSSASAIAVAALSLPCYLSLFSATLFNDIQNKPVTKFNSSRPTSSKEPEFNSPYSAVYRRITFHTNIKLRSTSFHDLNVLDSLDELGFNSPSGNGFASQYKLLSCKFKRNKI